MYELIDRTILDDGWRTSTYRRSNGSEFNVLIPPKVEKTSGRRTWNEASEHEMALRLGRGDS